MVPIMIIEYRILILLTTQIGSISSLIKPEKKCIPTEKMKTACHVCLCGSDGIFACFQLPTCNKLLQERSSLECIPLRLYVFRLTFCSCSARWTWHTSECREIFGSFLIDSATEKRISTPAYTSAVSCETGNMYLIDCNICICEDSGYFETHSCTNRKCSTGSKTDRCQFTDFLRIEDEICTCSEMNKFVNSLCLKVLRTKIQILYKPDIDAITDISEEIGNRRVNNHNCVPLTSYTINEIKCFCHMNGSFICNNTIDSALHKGDEHQNLYPELYSETDKCVPKKKYRYQCNFCNCTVHGDPICTNDECEDQALEFLLLPHSYADKASRGIYLAVD